jgi:hypothetical protein
MTIKGTMSESANFGVLAGRMVKLFQASAPSGDYQVMEGKGNYGR